MTRLFIARSKPVDHILIRYSFSDTMCETYCHFRVFHFPNNCVSGKKLLSRNAYSMPTHHGRDCRMRMNGRINHRTGRLPLPNESRPMSISKVNRHLRSVGRRSTLNILYRLDGSFSCLSSQIVAASRLQVSTILVWFQISSTGFVQYLPLPIRHIRYKRSDCLLCEEHLHLPSTTF